MNRLFCRHKNFMIIDYERPSWNCKFYNVILKCDKCNKIIYKVFTPKQLEFYLAMDKVIKEKEND